MEEEDHEQILQRVAAVDVSKPSVMVYTPVPQPSRAGQRRTRVWAVDAVTGAVLELADHLVAERVEKVTLESASGYWRIWFYLLEAAGLDVQLVRAADVKQAPGRPKRTNWMRCGWPSSPSGACCGPHSSPRRRSASCATTPGYAPT